MKNTAVCFMILSLALGLLAPASRAQQRPTPSTTPAQPSVEKGAPQDSKGKPANKPEPAKEERNQTVPLKTPGKTKSSNPARPEKPDQQGLPKTLKELINEFNQARDSFLDEQDKLKREIGSSTKEQREQIREKLSAHRDEWMQRQKELREELRSAMKELKSKLPEMEERIEEAKEGGRNRGRP